MDIKSPHGKGILIAPDCNQRWPILFFVRAFLLPSPLGNAVKLSEICDDPFHGKGSDGSNGSEGSHGPQMR